ncbi:hypothetical protein RXV86_19830 [Alisedimentitalea sp. MJ-SS2]|uniref:hypothetical protein n=1 Tax=Aliisedimentitalea sp. MJ-SS2 TaxID=3049795 RepID=UPI00290691CA|nr:hypothetical protein [Alisedimentitalea sp. MJ-SS2]MDU8929642.1 hypothetical protein [Alisedimentitalea sp. MJ-SS2]
MSQAGKKLGYVFAILIEQVPFGYLPKLRLTGGLVDTALFGIRHCAGIATAEMSE